MKQDDSWRMRDDSGVTPLLMATIYNHSCVVDFLLSSNAEVDVADDFGSTSLHLAAWEGYLQICKSLLSHKASLTAKTRVSSQTALFRAVRMNHPAVVELLLEKGSDPNDRCDGVLPLCKAAKHSHMDVLKLLVEYGADLNLENDDGYNALSLAAHHLWFKELEYLIEKGASGTPPSALGGKWKNLTFSDRLDYWKNAEVLRLLRDVKRNRWRKGDVYDF
ncbi:ankyrin repeat-containing domain protein [Phyllosticta capitalensis]